ncbi:GrpB family protein [Exiguobacterium antarcticum]|uniref:GrpB family protein n=1 Tax=Exiguobacterium antarcticum TaxID=132920 RepID=A0ABT6R059_9BACL|nr:GrpB family protein [Exiguobacterium antarcticum]MDI3234235.1 GrpB family protein [Exiguobacterium antarcticum]
MRQVIVIPYQTSWADEFEQEAVRLRTVFGERLLAVHHIGSTSVPGLSAKPILDILPVVDSLDGIEAFDAALEAIGYEAKGEFGMRGRRYYRKGGDNRTHHVHLYAVGNPEIARHVVFRDYLREHPQEVEAYSEIKEQLANQYPEDIDAYIVGKDTFVKEMEQRALVWWSHD